MDIQIRKAKSGDLNDMTELLRILFSIEKDFSFNKEAHEKGLIMLIEEPAGRSVILVAEVDENVVGMVTAQTVISTATGGYSAWLEDLVVLPEYQGKGIGRSLLDHLLKWCREKGCLRIQLLADRDNGKALEFYKREGWSGSNMIPFKQMLGL